MKLGTLLIATAAVMIASTAHAAQTIDATYEVDLSDQYDYVTGKYVPLTVPSVLDVSVIIPTTGNMNYDYGQTTISQFGNLGQTVINNPLLDYVPDSAAMSGKSRLSSDNYAFVATSDYTNSYIIQTTVQGDAYTYKSPNSYGDLNFSMTFQDYEPSRGGTGNADQPTDPSQLVSLLQADEANPAKFSSDLYLDYGDYSLNSAGSPVYTDGYSFKGSDHVISVSAAPEPSTWLLMMAGIGGIGLMLRCRRHSIATV